jgi:hypothetical protein
LSCKFPRLKIKIDKNAFSREVMLEAIVRYVEEDFNGIVPVRTEAKQAIICQYYKKY